MKTFTNIDEEWKVSKKENKILIPETYQCQIWAADEYSLGDDGHIYVGPLPGLNFIPQKVRDC